MPRTCRRLSVRETQIWEFILRYKQDNDGIAPSTREIINATEVPSGSMVHYYLRRLEEDGRIQLLRDEQGAMLARGIMVLGAAWQPPPF